MATCIFFFGGYKASINDIMKWQGSAAEQTSDDVFVFTYAWPAGAASDATSAVSKFRSAGTFDKALSAIQSAGKDTVYIVGHSSGCAIANAVDRALDDHANVTLVALDGFLPDRAQRARLNTQVWAATGGGGVSRNYKSLRDSVGNRLKVYRSSACSTSWALHFCLVNAAATDASVQGVATGYSNCRSNLAWM